MAKCRKLAVQRHIENTFTRREPIPQLLGRIEHSHVYGAASLHAGADFRDGPNRQQLPLLQDADTVADLGQLRKNVRADQNRLAGRRQPLDHFPQFDAGPRIEAGSRLIEYQHGWIVNHRAAQAQPLLHALR